MENDRRANLRAVTAHEDSAFNFLQTRILETLRPFTDYMSAEPSADTLTEAAAALELINADFARMRAIGVPDA